MSQYQPIYSDLTIYHQVVKALYFFYMARYFFLLLIRFLSSCMLHLKTIGFIDIDWVSNIDYRKSYLCQGFLLAKRASLLA
jgi:hypothetical protein